MYDYQRPKTAASPYKHWDRKKRDYELGRMMDYIMDLDAEGRQPPPKIQHILDLKRKPTEQEEDTLIAWSIVNTPGYYGNPPAL